jgi:hypothetical protein
MFCTFKRQELSLDDFWPLSLSWCLTDRRIRVIAAQCMNPRPLGFSSAPLEQQNQHASPGLTCPSRQLSVGFAEPIISPPLLLLESQPILQTRCYFPNKNNLPIRNQHQMPRCILWDRPGEGRGHLTLWVIKQRERRELARRCSL